MAASTRGHRDQAIGALLNRLAGEAIVDHVMQDDTAIAVNGSVHILPRTERGDDDRHLVFHTQRQIIHQPVVGFVDDQVDRIGRIVRPEFGGQSLQPFFKLRQGAGVQTGERPDDTGLALRDHQVRIGNDEQW